MVCPVHFLSLPRILMIFPPFSLSYPQYICSYICHPGLLPDYSHCGHHEICRHWSHCTKENIMYLNHLLFTPDTEPSLYVLSTKSLLIYPEFSLFFYQHIVLLPDKGGSHFWKLQWFFYHKCGGNVWKYTSCFWLWFFSNRFGMLKSLVTDNIFYFEIFRK